MAASPRVNTDGFVSDGDGIFLSPAFSFRGIVESGPESSQAVVQWNRFAAFGMLAIEV
jgi:hypothetical protein